MEKIIILMFFCFFEDLKMCYAQKLDNVWVMGYNWDSDIASENYKLIFDTFPPRLVIGEGKLFIDRAYASICDSTGNLKLYTNNCFLANEKEEFIQGGDTLTEGWELDWCNMYWWHPYDMYNLLIPRPGVPNQIYFFQKTTYENATLIYQNTIKYSVIKLGQNADNDTLILKHKKVLDNRLGYGQMTAVKHANGRDWWLPMPVEIGNKIFLVLITKDSVFVHHDQSLGPVWSDSGGFQATFSPDGSMYARYNRFYGLYLYDFDRCSGELSNLRYFPVHKENEGLIGSACFSPDNNLLYFSDYDSIFQLDIRASDIWASKQLVAVYDGFLYNFPTKFSYIINAPDGRLYVIPPSTTKAMHVINRPNLRGPACDVRQHDLLFPNPYGNPQNFPNFRLGALDGSPCDTLGFNNYPLADFRPEASDSNGLAWTFWDVSSYAPAHWLWDFGDGTMSNDTTAAHVFAAPGDYTVCLTVSNNYGTHTKCKIVRVMTTGVSSPGGKKAELWVYPNPSSGVVHFTEPVLSDDRISVFDMKGGIVFSGKAVEHKIDLSNLPNGTYFLNMKDSESGFVRHAKVVILK